MTSEILVIDAQHLLCDTYVVFRFRTALSLKYGENPHYRGACFAVDEMVGEPVKKPFEEVSGKDLSYNNILDCDCAWRTCTKWDSSAPAVCIVKHATPCGVARGSTLAEAYSRARACDSLSAFGGVAAFNGTLCEDAAKILKPHFLEVVVARDFTPDAVETLRGKSNLRLVRVSSDLPQKEIRSCFGGISDPRKMRRQSQI